MNTSSRKKGYLLLPLFLLLLLVACKGREQEAPAEPEPVSVTSEAETPTPSAEAASSESEALPEEDEVEAESEIPVIEEEEEEVPQDSGEEELDQILAGLTLEEKIAQLFVVTPEELVPDVSPVTAAGDATRNAFFEIPVGGLIYLRQNIESPDQIREMLRNTQAISEERLGLPAFICVDEEGGSVTRVAGNPNFDVPLFPTAREIGDTGDTQQAYAEGEGIGRYLHDLGFNVALAPVADVLSNPNNQVIGDRSFGSDPQLVSDMAEAVAEGLASQGVLATYKHFPGHGGTDGDTHEGYAYTDKTLEEMEVCELVPFCKAVENGVPIIMMSHISLPKIDETQTPASLSSIAVDGMLRGKLSYDGIVMTDAFNMGAIAQNYAPLDAVKQSLLAGADLFLSPGDLRGVHAGLVDAVRNGEITEERIDQSVRRILRVKMGLMAPTTEE